MIPLVAPAIAGGKGRFGRPLFLCETKRDLAVKLVERHFVFLETDREIPLERAKRGAGKDLRTQP